MTRQDRLNLTFVRNERQFTAVQHRSAYQSSLWGDTYLTPQEARIYITQMLQTLKRYKDKAECK